MPIIEMFNCNVVINDVEILEINYKIGVSFEYKFINQDTGKVISERTIQKSDIDIIFKYIWDKKLINKDWVELEISYPGTDEETSEEIIFYHSLLIDGIHTVHDNITDDGWESEDISEELYKNIK